MIPILFTLLATNVSVMYGGEDDNNEEGELSKDDEDDEGNDEGGGGGVRLHNKRRGSNASSNKTECHAHVQAFCKSRNKGA